MVREQRTVFSKGWVFAGCASEVSKTGEYLSLDVAGTPILIRNFEGTLKAFLNDLTSWYFFSLKP